MSKLCFTVGLEGNIGCGKSTATKKLKEKYGELEFDGHLEKVNYAHLALFYPNKPKYAWAMQWGQLIRRKANAEIALVRRTCVTNPTPTYLINDRDLAGDHAFLVWNFLEGNISPEETAVYYDELGVKNYDEFVSSKRLFAHLNAVVFVDAEPNLCRHRLEGERKNEQEKDIAFSYYRGLDSVHFCTMRDLVLKGTVPVYVYGSPGTDDPVKVKAFLDSIKTTDEAKRLKPVYIDCRPPPSKLQSTDIVYDENVGVNETVKATVKIEAKPAQQQSADQITDVYVNMDKAIDTTAMAQLKNVSYYPRVQMYHNVYVRLIFAQLRLGRRVHMYNMYTGSNSKQQ